MKTLLRTLVQVWLILWIYTKKHVDWYVASCILYLCRNFVDTLALCCRSSNPVSLGEWHKLRLTRTGRHAYLQVDRFPPAQILSPGPFTQLSLSLSLYLGGVPDYNIVSPKVKVKTSFIGCIQKVKYFPLINFDYR